MQTAAKLLLEPTVEADFDPNAYSYPERARSDPEVVDADLSKYFDTIPHCELMCRGGGGPPPPPPGGGIVDQDMLHLIKMSLEVPIEERDEDGTRVSGGKGSTSETPQGGVISPLLANLNRFLKYLRVTVATS